MKYVIRALGLSFLAAISVMAVTAVAAHAANQLVIETKVETAETALEATGGKGKLLVPSLSLELECTSSEIEGKGKNNSEGRVDYHILIHILYHGCNVVGNKFCKVYPTAADRTAKTNAGLLLAHILILIITSGSNRYAKATQVGAAPFSTIFMTKSTEGCTLPAENAVTGSTAFKIDTPETESLDHEFLDITVAEETTLGVELQLGAVPALLDEGNAKGKLVGIFLGKKFSFN